MMVEKKCSNYNWTNRLKDEYFLLTESIDDDHDHDEVVFEVWNENVGGEK